MSLYTMSQLRQKAELISFYEKRAQFKSASSILLEDFRGFSEYKTYDIFMSHSFWDAKQILALKIDIEKMGFSVYVDWAEDLQLNRSKVTKDTADLLRSRMKNCISLFFATSKTSTESKWMPWELGYFDGTKNKVAILPVLDIEQITNQYRGQEYLGLYPYVAKNKEQNTGKETLLIHEDEDAYINLKEWMQGSKPKRHR